MVAVTTVPRIRKHLVVRLVVTDEFSTAKRLGEIAGLPTKTATSRGRRYGFRFPPGWFLPGTLLSRCHCQLTLATRRRFPRETFLTQIPQWQMDCLRSGPASVAKYEVCPFDTKHLIGRHEFNSHADARVWNLHPSQRILRNFVGDHDIVVRQRVRYQIVVGHL